MNPMEQYKRVFKILVSTLLAIALLAVPVGLSSTPCLSADSSEPNVEWDKTFGGSEYNSGSSVQQTGDGGYIIAGYKGSYETGEMDVWLIKTDSKGNKDWDKALGGNGNDAGSSAWQTSDGGYIVIGTTESYGAGEADVWLVKTDSTGNKEWDSTFGGSEDDSGSAVQQTSDGGYIVVGNTWSYGDGDSDIWLIKTDSEGNKEWDRAFGGSGSDMGFSVQQTGNGGYIIAGYTDSYGAGEDDVWLIKTDFNGNKEWDKTFGGSGMDAGRSVRQTGDGGYIIAGSTYSYGAGSLDVWLIKTDSDGNKEWDGTFGGSDSDVGGLVRQTSDGGYIVSGETESYGAGGSDIWLIKTDSNGNKEWDKTIGGSEDDFGISIWQTGNGGYIAVGRTYSYGTGNGDVWLIKLSSEPSDEEEGFPWLMVGMIIGGFLLVSAGVALYKIRR